MPRLTSLVSRLMLDISALREHPPFRRVFVAQLVSQIGSQITVVALMFQVYDLTKSSLMVGLLGLVQVVPTVMFALVGGAIADATDRRRILLIAQVCMLTVSAALALLATLAAPPLWILYVLAACSATFAAIDGPTRSAIIPMLVNDSTLRSAVQLREVMTQSGRVFGPVIGGVLIGSFGLTTAYAVDAMTFVVALVLLVGLPSLRPTQRRRFEFSSITEGLTYVRQRPVLAATFYADLIAMILGMPRAVFPAFAEQVFNAGPEVVGLLFAAPAAGALLGVGLAGPLRHVTREGRAVLVCVAIWGASIAAFGLTSSLPIALILLAIAGWADMVSALFRQTILLETVPDELRGRMSSVHIMVVTGGPPLGDLEAGAAAEILGLRTSVVVGGVACIAGVCALGAAIPSFRTYRRPTPHGPT